MRVEGPGAAFSSAAFSGCAGRTISLPVDFFTSAARWPVALALVRKRSGRRSTAIRMASPSTGSPTAAYTGACTSRPPLGIPGTVALSSTEATVTVSSSVRPKSTP